MSKDLTVRRMCSVLRKDQSTDINEVLSKVGAVVEMILINGVDPEHRAAAAARFYEVLQKRITRQLN